MVEHYRWKIFRANLDPARGSEQAGKRLVLIVSVEEVNQALPIVTVLPLTSARPGRKVYPTEVWLAKEATCLEKDSIAMAHQIRTISKGRLGEECGRVEQEELREQVRQAVRRHLGF